MIVKRLNNSRSNYIIVDVIDGKVFLEDLDNGGMSVTNDAENVYLDVTNAYRGHRVIYKDSTGLWDEIIMTDDGDLYFKAYYENR